MMQLLSIIDIVFFYRCPTMLRSHMEEKGIKIIDSAVVRNACVQCFRLWQTGRREKRDYLINKKTNGEMKDLLEKSGWYSMCSEDDCYFINDDNDYVNDFNDADKKDLISNITQSTTLKEQELRDHLIWMNMRRSKSMLTDSERLDEKRAAKLSVKDKGEKTDTTKKETSNNKTNTSKNEGSNNSSTTNNSTSNNTNNSSSSNTSGNAVSTEKRNALGSAKNYLNAMPFSHSGLIKQLEFEGYSNEAATYAANNCGADWNQQAVKSGKSYLSAGSGFSQSGLIKQLEFEGYTSDQASHGANNCGADWNNEAAKSASNYMSSGMNFSRDGLIGQLLFEGFTQPQAEYGVSTVGY